MLALLPQKMTVSYNALIILLTIVSLCKDILVPPEMIQSADFNAFCAVHKKLYSVLSVAINSTRFQTGMVSIFNSTAVKTKGQSN